MAKWGRRPVHTSWRIAVASLGFVGGVWSVLFAPNFSSGWVLVILLIALCLSSKWVLVVIFLASAVVGNWYGSGTYENESVSRQLVGMNIVVRGTVKEDVSHGERGDSRIQLTGLSVRDESFEGTLWVSTTSKAEILRGDTLIVSGLIDQGFGTFIGMMKKADVREVIRPVPGDVGRVVRDGFADAVRRGIDEPQASLGIGYLTGQKSALSADLAEALQIAGLTHIVVASGYNLTILVRLSRRLFVKVSKFAAVTSSSLMISGFVAVTGLSPSMTRAGIVSGLSLLTWSYGRSCHPFVLLALVAAMTVIWQPNFVWGDMGWQLSFAAFFGVMVVAPLLQAYFFGNTPPGVIRQVLGETIAAHIVTLPITVSAFGAISHVAIIANVLIVPLVPLAMLLTFIVGLAGLIMPSIATFVGLPASWLLSYMTETSMFLANLPWAQMPWSPPWWLWIIYVAVLGIACWWMWCVTKLELRDANPVI